MGRTGDSTALSTRPDQTEISLDRTTLSFFFLSLRSYLFSVFSSAQKKGEKKEEEEEDDDDDDAQNYRSFRDNNSGNTQRERGGKPANSREARALFFIPFYFTGRATYDQ